MQDTTQELWRTEFDKQYTKELLKVLWKQATALTKRFHRGGSHRGRELDVGDRINTAVMKLLEGTRVWDPARVDLGDFLLGVISSDLTAELRRAKRWPEISLDQPKPSREDDYSGEALGDRDEGSPVEAHLESSGSFYGVWCLAIPHLKARAATDDNVLRLIGAFEEGVYLKREVMRLLGWDSNKHQRVYRRLLRIAETTDEDVRDAIAQALAN